jgi:hypothetical protein
MLAALFGSMARTEAQAAQAESVARVRALVRERVPAVADDPLLRGPEEAQP